MAENTQNSQNNNNLPHVSRLSLYVGIAFMLMTVFAIIGMIMDKAAARTILNITALCWVTMRIILDGINSILYLRYMNNDQDDKQK